MRYPLRVLPGIAVRVVDADHRIICTIGDIPRAPEFAAFIVQMTNRRHRWRRWFRPYTREDWIWERNSGSPL